MVEGNIYNIILYKTIQDNHINRINIQLNSMLIITNHYTKTTSSQPNNNNTKAQINTNLIIINSQDQNPKVQSNISINKIQKRKNPLQVNQLELKENFMNLSNKKIHYKCKTPRSQEERPIYRKGVNRKEQNMQEQ